QVDGVAISLALLAGELRARGHTVFVIAPKFAGYRDLDAQVLRLPAVRLMRQPPYNLAGLGTPRASRALRRLRLDVVHAQTPLALGLAAYATARLGGLPLVGTYHTVVTDYTHYLRAFGSTWPIRRLARGLSALSCNVCDQVVTPSAKV